MNSPLKTAALLAGVAISTGLLPLRAAWAVPVDVPFSVLLESNADRTNNEIYLANYDNYAALMSNTLAGSSGYSALNVSAAFRVGGFTRVPNGGYSVLLESNADRTSNEIFIANYASYGDLVTNTLSGTSAYSALNVSTSFSVGGFTFDGKGYSVMLESNADRTNNEIYLAHYDSFDNLMTNTLSAQSGYSSLNVSADFSVGGFTFNGEGYSVLLESNADRVNNEIYVIDYASWADLISNVLGPASDYSDLNVSANFGVGGFAASVNFAGGGSDFPGDGTGDGGGLGGNPDDRNGDGGGLGGNPDDRDGDGGGTGGTPIPEPSTLALVGLAAAGMALVTRRRRRQ